MFDPIDSEDKEVQLGIRSYRFVPYRGNAEDFSGEVEGEMRA